MCGAGVSMARRSASNFWTRRSVFGAEASALRSARLRGSRRRCAAWREGEADAGLRCVASLFDELRVTRWVGPARDIYVADKMRRFDEQKFAEDVFEQRDSGGDFVRLHDVAGEIADRSDDIRHAQTHGAETAPCVCDVNGIEFGDEHCSRQCKRARRLLD